MAFLPLFHGWPCCAAEKYLSVGNVLLGHRCRCCKSADIETWPYSTQISWPRLLLAMEQSSYRRIGWQWAQTAMLDILQAQRWNDSSSPYPRGSADLSFRFLLSEDLKTFIDVIAQEWRVPPTAAMIHTEIKEVLSFWFSGTLCMARDLLPFWISPGVFSSL